MISYLKLFLGSLFFYFKKRIFFVTLQSIFLLSAVVPRNGAPNALVTFAQVREAMLNRGLLNRISLPNGNGLLMPQGGPRMPQATIDLVSKWQQDGLLEQ